MVSHLVKIRDFTLGSVGNESTGQRPADRESDWVKQDITVTFPVMCSGKQRALEKDLEEEGASRGAKERWENAPEALWCRHPARDRVEYIQVHPCFPVSVSASQASVLLDFPTSN